MNNQAFFSFLMATVCFIGYIVNLFVGINYLKSHNHSCQTIKSDTIKYVEKLRLNQQCWVRALDMLDIIRKKENIKSAAMILGYQNGVGHAWIEYVDGDEIIKFDPTIPKIIETKTVKN